MAQLNDIAYARGVRGEVGGSGGRDVLGVLVLLMWLV